MKLKHVNKSKSDLISANRDQNPKKFETYKLQKLHRCRSDNIWRQIEFRRIIPEFDCRAVFRKQCKKCCQHIVQNVYNVFNLFREMHLTIVFFFRLTSYAFESL